MQQCTEGYEQLFVRGEKECPEGMARKTAYLGLMCAAALILSYIESLIPFFAGIPGMKLGLPNAAVVTVLYLYSWKEAALVNLVRILAVSFIFGNVFSMAYSVSGAALSLLCMQLMKRTGRFSTAGVSVAGGIAHNAGQVIIAAAVVENVRIGYYFIPLAIAGVVTGALIGLTAGLIIPRLKPLADMNKNKNSEEM